MNYPRVDIDCTKIYHNTQTLINRLSHKGISITPVTKVCLGHPIIANTLINAGAQMIADSRVENIEKMRESGMSLPSQAASVVKYCNISLNSEIAVIEQLSRIANQTNIIHGIIIMVELGDLREGVMPNNLLAFIGKIINLPNIVIKGIGTNLACRYGISPDDDKMSQLSALADEVEKIFSIQLDIISGGNSASISWALNHGKNSRINNLRIGEAIFLGCEPLYQEPIEGLFTDAITLTAEVIESKIKPSLPWGVRGKNAFGEKQAIPNRGDVSQALIALGRLDVNIAGLKPPTGITIVSSTSDHLVIETSGESLFVGQKVQFNLDYGAVLLSMSSPYTQKSFNHRNFDT
ncbi:alanine/ornithine racemase family PLP-dependent enzyme [Moritella viscosa]